ncbi:hypothetical protein HYDPIDRAFT_89466 [Hydnomerulius pinastri MD-312]|uniref:Protein-S-isoprenylcysteine O-methyltransferase n=1 Tax=Hydnomerulius pinastri MD-312 TaxID=994086 RepID=A0A0C9VGR2_9AGAM|nr:hypothetical protein HYDPIDRAFT_89466 [Hydnomerulius pinastri MD-312]
MYWVGALAETAAVLSPRIARYVPSYHWLLPVTHLRDTPLNRGLVVGSILVSLGSLIRWLCYRELGSSFTFQIKTAQEHKLVKTGPYSIVRHPSYNGMWICQAGVTLIHGSRGSWLRESGVLSIPGVKEAVEVFCVAILVGIIGLLGRIDGEDCMLHEAFGERWVRWAKRVKYRLIPGVY